MAIQTQFILSTGIIDAPTIKEFCDHIGCKKGNLTPTSPDIFTGKGYTLKFGKHPISGIVSVEFSLNRAPYQVTINRVIQGHISIKEINPIDGKILSAFAGEPLKGIDTEIVETKFHSTAKKDELAEYTERYEADIQYIQGVYQTKSGYRYLCFQNTGEVLSNLTANPQSLPQNIKVEATKTNKIEVNSKSYSCCLSIGFSVGSLLELQGGEAHTPPSSFPASIL